jgi:hypothetical protein
MTIATDPRVLARASLVPPAGMQRPGADRIDVYLMPTADGRVRWFRDDGSPTVVDALDVDSALRTARLVWRHYQLTIENASHHD